MIQAQLADGRTLEFPDGTDPAVIQQTVKRLIGESSPAAPDAGQLMSDFEAAKQAGDFQAADKIRQQMSQLQSGAIKGALDAGLTMARGIVAEPLAGLAGGVSALADGSEAGAETVENVRSAIAGQPLTQEGQETLQDLGEALSFIPDIAGGAGELAFEATGSPGAAAAAEGAVTILPELLGLGAFRRLRVGTKLLDDAGNPTRQLRKALDDKGLVYENLTPEARAMIPAVADKSFLTGKSLVPENAKKALAEQIQSGGRDDALAGLKVVDGVIEPDAKGVEALRQGYAPGFVQSVKTFNPETRKQAKRMLNIARRIKKQERVGLDVRPGVVVGDAVTKRVNLIRNKATSARKELNSIARNSLANKEIDGNIVLDRLAESLDNLDIELRPDAQGLPVPVFDNSVISKNKSAQKAVKDAVDLLKKGERGQPVTALQAHKLKRQFDDLIDFKKKSKDGLSESGRNFLKDIRASLNQSIRAVDSDYARVNDVMSEALTALDDFDKATGAQINIFGEGANKAIGTKMRGLMSNIDSRVNLENALNQLDDTAKKLNRSSSKQVGFPSAAAGEAIDLSEDIKDLAMFANALDARFGAVAKTSFQGNIEQAINRVLNQGISQEVIQQGANKAASAANRLRGVNEFNAFESMLDLLEESP